MDWNIANFPQTLVPFGAAKVDGARALWLNREDSQQGWTPDEFTRHFAYAMPDRHCFPDLDFDLADTVSLQAEQYGGQGIGANGGGVRCGNLLVNGAHYQLKGIGANQVVGDHDRVDHASGICGVDEAVREALNTVLMQQALPVGVASTYGIILLGTSRHGSFSPQRQFGRAILVREACVRPAHFLRAGFYKIPRRHRLAITADMPRVRTVNRKLAALLGGQSAFVQQLGGFLGNCANQFAFAKLMRLAHGAMSPSNIVADGRWLDLTNASALPAGLNYAAGCDGVPFLEEVMGPANIVEEWLATFGKYNGLDLNSAPLLSYYFEQFQAYCSHHLWTLLGLPRPAVANQAEVTVLASFATRLIERQASAVIGIADHPLQGDGMADALVDLYASLASVSVPSPKSHIEAFAGMVRQSFSQQADGMQWCSFVRAGAIRALRKSLYGAFFNIDRLKAKVAENLAAGAYSQLGPLIDAVQNMAAWIYDRRDTVDEVCVLDLSGFHLAYKPSLDTFVLRGEQEASFASVRDLRRACDRLDAQAFVHCGYDFRPALARQLELLDLLACLPEAKVTDNTPCEILA